MYYDNGHEYLRFFNNLFKYTAENDLIDYRKLEVDDYVELDDYGNFGFRNLINPDDPCDINYDKYLRLDNKCHYFGGISQLKGNRNIVKKRNSDETIEYVSCFNKRVLSEVNEETEDIVGYPITDVIRCNYIDDSSFISYKDEPSEATFTNGELSNTPIVNVTGRNPRRAPNASINSRKEDATVKKLSGTDIKTEAIFYGDVNKDLLGEEGEYNKDLIDREVTDQIINTKRMDIDFFIKNKEEYSKEWLEEVKYIDSIILPYLTQMMPSGVICRINYKTVK